MHEFFFEKLRNPAHAQRAGAMRQFPLAQLGSTVDILGPAAGSGPEIIFENPLNLVLYSWLAGKQFSSK